MAFLKRFLFGLVNVSSSAVMRSFKKAYSLQVETFKTLSHVRLTDMVDKSVSTSVVGKSMKIQCRL